MDEIEYCEYKILLKGELFTNRDDFRHFWRKLSKLAKLCDVKVSADPDALEFLTRRVYFYDTPGFDLYRNAFILRKRVRIVNGFAGEHELTFKFRHPELSRAQGMEIPCDPASGARIKFKEEVLQPRDGSSGFRSIFSHNHVRRSDALEVGTDIGTVSASFPALATLGLPPSTQVALVNDMIVEEVAADTGRLSFGGGYEAKSSLALWRDCSHEHRFIGEFSFQARFSDYNGVAAAGRDRSRHFFSRVQSDLHDWVAVGSTKTALIYGAAIGHD